MKLFLAALMVLGTTGCVEYRMSTSTSAPLTAKPANCDFRVVNLPPRADEYEEIATLSLASKAADDPDQFKSAVRADVCKVGGDMVVTEVNGAGRYVRGTVLRKRLPPPAAPPPAPAAAP